MKTKTLLFAAVLAFSFLLLTFTSSAQWRHTRLDTTRVGALAFKGDTIFAGASSCGLFFSINDGNRWDTCWLDPYMYPAMPEIFALAISGSYIYAGSDEKVYLSSNNGSNWVGINTNGGGDVDALAINGNNIFAGTDGSGIHLSTNNGGSWTTVDSGLTGYLYVYALAIKGDTIFAGGDGIHSSTNNGSNWTAVNTGLDTNYVVYALAINGSNIFAGAGEYGVGGGVYLSSNNGGSWTAVNNGLPNDMVMELAISGSNIFAGTYSNGVYVSSNNGSNWTAWNTGLTDTSIQALAIKGDTVFAGTYWKGVWKRPLSEITGIEKIKNNENNIAVYPNPATDNLTIDVSATFNIPATIEIANIQGKVIKQQTTNVATTNLDVSTLARGMYFVKVKTENGVAVKKFIKE